MCKFIHPLMTFSANILALSPEEKEDGFVELFNGKDLTAWTFDEMGKPSH